MKPRTYPRPTPLGWASSAALIGLVVAAAVTDTPELVPLVVVLALPLLLGPFIALRRARRLARSAEFHSHLEPPIVPVGSVMEWALAVTNRERRGRSLPTAGIPSPSLAWRAPGGVRRPTWWRRWTAPGLQQLEALPAPSPGTTVTIRTPVPTSTRGVVELPESSCWTHDLFGLFGAPGPSTPTAAAAIYPVSTAPLQELDVLVATGTDGGTLRSDRGVTLGDLEGIRPYVAGDRLSLIHWQSRLRYGAWFVREFAGEQGRACVFGFDDRAGVHRRDAFEQLVAATMWVIEHSLRSGHPVQIYLVSGPHFAFVATDEGLAHARRVMAGITPATGLPAPRMAAVPYGTVILTTPTGSDRTIDDLPLSMTVAARPARPEWTAIHPQVAP